VLSGDDAAYREFCGDMLQQFRRYDVAEVADRVCKVCLLTAGAVKLAQLPVERLRQVASESPPDGNGAYFRVCYALVSYRAGDFQEAITWAEQVVEQNTQARALALVVRALAEYQLGQPERARQTLADVSALIPAEFRTLGSDAFDGPLHIAEGITLHDWLIPAILRREASALIEGPPHP
jgi:tetratricopeptide (TPR) repeat protein